MKTLFSIVASISALAVTLSAFAADQKPVEKAKPYPLKTCVVSDEKLGGDMGDPSRIRAAK